MKVKVKEKKGVKKLLSLSNLIEKKCEPGLYKIIGCKDYPEYIGSIILFINRADLVYWTLEGPASYAVKYCGDYLKNTFVEEFQGSITLE